MRDENPFVIPNYGPELARPYAHAEWDQGALLGTGDRRTSSLRQTQARKRLAILFVGIIVLFGSLYIRSGYLQVVAGDIYRARAEGNRLHTERLFAPRGEILDQFGRPLVQNDNRFILSVLPQEMPRSASEQRAVLSEVAAQLGLSDDDIAKRWQAITSRYLAEVVLYETIPHESALRFYQQENNFPAFRLTAAPQRLFHDSSLALVIGATGHPSEADLRRNPDLYPTDTIGVSGLEFHYDEQLRGQAGSRAAEVDSRGRTVELTSAHPPQPGRKLITTLDQELQAVVFASMQKALAGAQANRGAAVVLDPRSGAVRAIVSFPSYDPQVLLGRDQAQYEKLIQDSDRPLFFRAISGTYPSGSTIKPFLAAAALAEKIITPQTTILSTGGIRIGGWFFPDWRPGGHGPTNVTKAIADSVNTFFYVLGGGDPEQSVKGMGIDTMRRYVESFGFNQRLGIDLPGEENGFFPSAEWKENTKGERWYIGDTYHAAIGQGDVLVTPLQMAVATATIANHGSVFRPHLAAGEAVLLRTALPAERDLEVIRNAMREAVLTGSARRLASLPVAVAGKTGTAQGNAGRPPHAWFIGFGPYAQASIALAIIVEEGGEGSATAVPVAHDIFKWYHEHRVLKTVD